MFKLTLQNFAGGDLALKLFIAEIARVSSRSLNFRQRHSLTARMFQRVTPKLMLMDDRAAFKQMLLCPINRLFRRNASLKSPANDVCPSG
jgi:hypothetical protein